MWNPMKRSSKKSSNPDESPMILFLGGLSGAGKTSFARDYLHGRRGWCHLEIDVDEGDGMVEHGLKAKWDKFFDAPHNPKPMHQELLERARQAERKHVVLSFSSRQIFTKDKLVAGRGYFHFAYLYGDPGRCLQSFLERKRAQEGPKGKDHDWTLHWATNNVVVIDKCKKFGCQAYHCVGSPICQLNEEHNRKYLIDPFEPSGERRSHESIYEDVLKVNR